MQSLDLNLSTRPFRNNVPLWVGYGAALLLLILFTGWSISSYTGYSRKLGELRNEVGMLTSQTRDLEQRDRRVQAAVLGYDLDALSLQADKANEIIEWGAFSWTRLFNRMAEIQPNRVRMTSVRPIFGVRRTYASGHALDGLVDDAQRGVPVSIHAVAHSYNDMLEMQQALFDDEHFGDVEMQRLRRDERGQEYLFEAQFMYYPDAEVAPEPTDEDPDAAEQAAAEGEPDTAATDEESTGEGPGPQTAVAATTEGQEDAPLPSPDADGAPASGTVEAKEGDPDPPRTPRSRVRTIPQPGKDKSSEDD